MRLVLLLGALAAGGGGGGGGALAAPADAPPPREPDQTIDLRSDRLTVEHGRRRAIFSGDVTATRGELALRCPEVVASYDASSRVKDVVCVGAVTATEGPRTMTAEQGTFDNATGVLTLEGRPALTEGERRLTGERLTYDVERGVARLERARGELPAEEAPGLPGAAGSGPLVVEGPRLVHQVQEDRTVVAGGVTATRGDLVMRASRLVATYGEDGKLERARTTGGPVTVRQRDRRARADRAVFTSGGRMLVLEGEPQVTEGASSLTGRRVIFHLADDRVEVEEPRAIFPLGAALPGGKP